MISVHDHAGLDELARRCRVDPFRVRRFRTAFHKKQRPATEALKELPAAASPQFSREVDFHPLTLATRQDSQCDGATKLLFRTRSGELIESVILRIASGRTSLCLSTQAGCAAACAFCATGSLGLSRNLEAAEILDQVTQANLLLESEGRQVRNLVFMGMGEPFHNEAELFRALDWLAAREGLHINPRRMLVSTVGIPDAMVRCAKRFPRLRLALSLHSARAEVRERIMPVARRHPLGALREALLQAAALQGELPMIEYLLLRGVNDTAADVVAVGEFLRGMKAHINLIPYNAIHGPAPFSGTDPARRGEFAAALRQQGFTVTTRYSLGADIAAACGQLARVTAAQTPGPPLPRPIQAAA